MTDHDLRNRMRQIKIARQEYKKDNPYDQECSPKTFLDYLDEYARKDKYLLADNPLCGFKALTDCEAYVTYYCPIEDFSDEDLDRVHNLTEKISGKSREL